MFLRRNLCTARLKMRDPGSFSRRQNWQAPTRMVLYWHSWIWSEASWVSRRTQLTRAINIYTLHTYLRMRRGIPNQRSLKPTKDDRYRLPSPLCWCTNSALFVVICGRSSSGQEGRIVLDIVELGEVVSTFHSSFDRSGALWIKTFCERGSFIIHAFVHIHMPLLGPCC